MARSSLQAYFRIIVLIGLAIFNPVIVEGQTDGFSKEPADIQVLAGETGHLDCVLTRGNGTDCYWNRNDQKVNTDETDRYRFSGDIYNGDCSIDILNSNVAMDDGQWECGIPQTSQVYGSKSRQAQYTVLITPNSPVIKVNGKKITNGGYIVINSPHSAQPSVVECQSENGKPAANLTWTITTGQKLEGNYSVSEATANQEVTATLLLTTTRDEGWEGQELTCQVSHPAYPDQEVPIAFGIVASPRTTKTVNLTSTYNAATINVPKNKDVSLSCLSDGIPAPDSQLRSRVSSSEKWSPISSSEIPTNNYTVLVSAHNAQFMCFVSDDKWSTELSSNVVTIVTSDGQKIGIAAAVVYLVVVTMMGSHQILTL